MSPASASSRPESQPLERFEQTDDASALDPILNRINSLTADDLQSHGAWDDLDALSKATTFEGIEATSDGVFKSGKGRFEASVTVYVTLNYGDSKDGVSTSDSYPATVAGRYRGENVDIETISVDTTSFYE